MLRSSLLLVGLAAAGGAHAQTFELPSSIDQAIEQSQGQIVGAPGGAAYRVDPRLRLARCPSALSITPAGSTAVEVSCLAIGWRLRVPLMGTISGATPAVEAIKRGDTVKILMRGSGFEIATSGVALEDGAVGNGVRVKSVTDGSIFRAMVVESGFVELRD